MRISDWSSDVCSSDLQFHFLERRDAVLRTADPRVGPDRDRDAGRVEIADILFGEAIFANAQARRGVVLAPGADLVVLQLIAGARRGVEGARLLDPGDRVGLEHAVLVEVRDTVDAGGGVELGRASCRGRVCQSVLITVDEYHN